LFWPTLKNQFSAIKTFGVFFRSSALNSSDSEYR
jgi:hypothetical protein